MGRDKQAKPLPYNHPVRIVRRMKLAHFFKRYDIEEAEYQKLLKLEEVEHGNCERERMA